MTARSIFELDERDTRRALQFVEAYIAASRGDNAGLVKVLDQMRNGELEAVRTLCGMAEALIGMMATAGGVETVEDRITAAIARLTARADQIDAAEQDAGRG